MDSKVLEAMLVQLVQVGKQLDTLHAKIDIFTVDLSEFSEKFEEVITELERERRLDGLYRLGE